MSFAPVTPWFQIRELRIGALRRWGLRSGCSRALLLIIARVCTGMRKLCIKFTQVGTLSLKTNCKTSRRYSNGICICVVNKGGVLGFVRATPLCRFSSQKCGLFYTYFKCNLHAWQYINDKNSDRWSECCCILKDVQTSLDNG